MHDGPLDMRMSSEGVSAKDIIDTYSEEKLASIFFRYGEEKLSKVIAKNIKKNCKEINTTLELVEIIKSATGANYFYKNHPERKIFQALRIEVNDELTVLEKVLPDAINLLKKGGRIGVITFHSLEDRIVKLKYRELENPCTCPKEFPMCICGKKPLVKVLSKKGIAPTKEEIEENPRSRSAKVRVVEKR